MYLLLIEFIVWMQFAVCRRSVEFNTSTKNEKGPISKKRIRKNTGTSFTFNLLGLFSQKREFCALCPSNKKTPNKSDKNIAAMAALHGKKDFSCDHNESIGNEQHSNIEKSFLYKYIERFPVKFFCCYFIHYRDCQPPLAIVACTIF